MCPSDIQDDYNFKLMRIEESIKDKAYQRDLKKYYSLIEKANEKYSILNSLNMFDSNQSAALIDLCNDCAVLEEKIREKREYYEVSVFRGSPPLKTLAMLYEKMTNYSSAADICIRAIKAGYIEDGTKGGMRGRLARMIKKGNLELTDEMKRSLEI